jgi:hypothetical protein
MNPERPAAASRAVYFPSVSRRERIMKPPLFAAS